MQLLAGNPRTDHKTSYDVIPSHENGHVNNFSQNRLVAVGEGSLCLSCHVASTDAQLPGSFVRSGHLTWPKVKISNGIFGVKMCMF